MKRIIKVQDMAAIAQNLSSSEIVAYGRKSTKNESSSKSLNDQRECCFEQLKDEGISPQEGDITDIWLSEGAGYSGDLWWENGGASGLPGDITTKQRTRPAFTKIMQGIINGTIKLVVTYSLDRLWRSAAIAGQAIDIMRDNGCLLLDHNGFCDQFSAEGRSFILNSAINAQSLKEHSQISSPRGVRKSREKGKIVGQCHSLGMRAVGGGTGKINHIEEEQEVVNRIFRLYLIGENGNGPLSPEKIAELLMSEGFIWTPDLHAIRAIVRSKYTRKVIYASQILDCLKDVRYIGLQKHDKKEWPCPALLNNGQPIVPYELFFRVQEKTQLRAHVSNASANKVALSGRVRCGIHGLPLSKQTNTVIKDGVKEKRSYWLVRNIKGRIWCDHSMPSVRVNDLDEFIDDVLAPLILKEITDRGTVINPETITSILSGIDRKMIQRQNWLDIELPKQVSKAQLGEADSYDEVTLRATARQMRHELDTLRTEKLSLIANAEDQLLASRLKDIKDISQSDRIDALRAIICWVAVLPNNDALVNMKKRLTKPADNMGNLVILTKWGTYFTIRMYRHAGVHGNRCHLRLATEEEAIGGVADFPDPESFFRGLERGYLGQAYEFNPRDVTPGYSPGSPISIAEFDLDA